MKKIWRSAGSLQIGILLLSLLTAASLVGVIVPQDLARSLYIKQWGPVAGTLLLLLGADHLFSTFWYRSLLTLFSINILICTSIRLRISISNIRTVRFLTKARIEALPHHTKIVSEESPEVLVKKTTDIFKKHHLRYHARKSEEATALFAGSGSFRETGSALLHFCLLPLLAGGLVAILTGYSYRLRLSPGDVKPVRDRQFSIRCDYFSLERNENGAVKDYKSGLTIIDSSGATLAEKEIEVNHPLVYKGIKFYQSSYSVDPVKIDSIRLVLTGSSVGSFGKAIVINELRKQIPVHGSDVRVTAEKFISDFIFDTKTRSARSRSYDHENPALLVTIQNGNDTLFNGWVFQKFGMMHHKDTACGVSFMSYARKQSTGLLVKKNPGGGLIWFGIIGMSLGVFLVFWVPRRKFWAVIEKDVTTGSGCLSVGGSFMKDDSDAEGLWETIKTEIEA